jgi:hypothetical protein
MKIVWPPCEAVSRRRDVPQTPEVR